MSYEIPRAALAERLIPYSERNSVEAESNIAALLAEPSMPLGEAELTEAYEFSQELISGKSDTVSCKAVDDQGNIVGLDEIYLQNVNGQTHSFYIDYFSTLEGQEALQKLGIDNTNDSLQNILTDIDTINAKVDHKQLRSCAVDSINWRHDRMADRLAEPEDSTSPYDAMQRFTINYQPEKLLTKLEHIQAYRQFYRTVKHNLALEPFTLLQEAKTTLLNVHIARVNNMMASLYPWALRLSRQLDTAADTEHTQQLRQRLGAAVPLSVRAFESQAAESTSREDYEDRFAARLDLIRNGAALDADGSISPLDSELVAYTERLTQPTAEADKSRQLFNDEEVVVMAKTKWQAPHMKQLLEAVLQEWGLLSQHEVDWQVAAEREGAAEDGQWQVVVSPGKLALSVDGRTKIMYVPKEFNRGLLAKAPAGALPGAAHELIHVLHVEQDKLRAQVLPIAGICGRRAVTMREMAGIIQERHMHSYVGQERPTNPHNVRGMAAKMAGLSQLAVYQAFNRSMNNGKEPDAISHKDRLRAVKGGERLYRSLGHDSQPLDYVEQQQILDGLQNVPEDTAWSFSVCAASFALIDSVALHKYGLHPLNLQPGSKIPQPADVVTKIFKEKYLSKIMGKEA